MLNNDFNINPLEATGANVTGPDSISEFRELHMTEDVAGDPTAYAMKVMLMLGVDPYINEDFSMTNDNISYNKATRLSEDEMMKLIADEFNIEKLSEDFTEADLFSNEELKSTLVDDEELACYIASLESQNLTEVDLFTGEGFSDAELDNIEKFLDELPHQELTEEEQYHFDAAQDWCRNILENANNPTPCAHSNERLTCLDCLLEDD